MRRPRTLTRVSETREERRLVTCIFLDIVGSTDLTVRLGPERQKRALDAAFSELKDRIVAEGGTVEKYIGDAVYALFGAPVAHADDPLRALRAALACRSWAAGPASPFGIRIGVETGEAVVDLSAVESTQQRMSVGPVVNMAARLEQAAEPGQILVGPTCHAATETTATFRSLGPMTFKGFTEMEVWALEAIGSTTTTIDLPFVGRSSDLEILRLAYARSRQRPVLALVSGPPGQGKTRLVKELVDSTGGTTFVARFRPAGESGAAAPLRGLLGGPGGSREQVGTALVDVADPAERERIARAVLHSAGLEQDERLARLPNEERTDEIVHAWRRYFAAGGTPLPVVWFEDLHWADEETVRLVDRLTLSAGPLFVIATARPEFAQAAGFRPGGDRFFVELGPLESADAQALAGHAGTVDAATVERAQGNPLFIVELARTSSSGGTLPLTLQGALGARLDELGAEDRQLLSHASVIGDTFTVGDAVFLSGRDPSNVAPALARLADLLYLRRVDGAYRFHHNMLRDVTYGRLLVADRMGLHARLAREQEDLDPDVRAHHWWQALRPPDADWVWADSDERDALRRAAAQAHIAAAERHLERHDARRALEVLGRAEQLVQDDADRARIDRAWGRASAMDGKGDASWERFERAVAYHRRQGTVPADLYFEWLHVPVWFTGFFIRRPPDDEVRALIAEGEDAARAHADAATQARLRMLRARLDGDVALGREAVDAADGVLLPEDLAAMLAQLAQMQFEIADLDAMAASSARLQELSGRIADPDVAFATRRRVAIWRGDIAEAGRLATALEAATRAAGPHMRSHALGTLSWQAEAEGDWAEVRRIASEVGTLMRENEGTKFCAFAGSSLACAAIAEAREGRLDEARALLERARETIQTRAALWWPNALAAVGDRSALVDEPMNSSPHVWTGHATACLLLGEYERALEAASRLETMAARGAWLAGATAEAIRDEVAGRTPDGPGHRRLRERGYLGTSAILMMRAR